MRFIFLAILLATGLFLTGCQNEAASSEAASSSEMTAVIAAPEAVAASENDTMVITSENLSSIAQKQWFLQAMTVDAQSVVLAEKKPFIKFSDQGKVNGSTSVNIFMGSVEIDADGLAKWFPLNTTRMAGPEDCMKQESVFVKALPKTTQVRLDQGCLKLSDADGKTVLIFHTKTP